LIWQSRLRTRPWIERLHEIIDSRSGANPRFRSGAWRHGFDSMALFEPLTEASFEYVQRGTVETIVDRVASISYIAALSEDDRRPVLDEVRELLATDPDTARAEVIELPYRADVFWARTRPLPTATDTGFVVAVNTSPGGVPKRPMAGTTIRALGLDGDRQADREHHGGPYQAVCLYSIEAIERIAAEGHQAFPGAYGENLTLAGIDWGSVRGGDRLRIGDHGPVLQITDDATPCAKQARWFTEGHIARISILKYPEDVRWYASVVEEGPVAAGDTVTLL
jgi:MOSC domain-containing protein YiiM